MTLRSTPLLLLLLLGSSRPTSLAAQTSQQAPPPNVIFILCDDLGWGDLGVFYQNESSHNKKFATPRLDQMASQGIQLRNHYCPAPVCAPSRASLLQGVHQGHCDVRDNQFDKALPTNHTLASVLKAAGYRTAIVGKYGLQGESEQEGSGSLSGPEKWPAYPTKRGFDEFFGYVRHRDGHMHYPANAWPLGDSPIHQTPKEVWHNDQEISAQLDRCYTTDLFTAYAKKWIADQVGRDGPAAKPFFLFLAYDTPHAALQVPASPYPKGGGLHGGVQWTGQAGAMINTAQGEIDSYRYPEHTGKGWSDVEERFATMVKRIDDCVGDLLQTLRDLHIDNNTLVIFTSDNGPHHEAYLKGAQYDPTSFQSYGPFDGTKRDTWEGGIRVPTLAWWPSRIPGGTIDTTPSQFHDWMATMADVAGVASPAVCDGVSLMPSLTATGERNASQVYVEYAVGGKTRPYEDFEKRKRNHPRGQMQVVMLGGYKGLRVNITDPHALFEIYELEKDPSETKNLADTSEKFKQLQLQMQRQVLRMRRSNASAPRPYDGLPIPALPERSMSRGMIVAAKPGSFDYTPNFDAVPSTAHLVLTKVPHQPIDLGTGVYLYAGCLNIPAEGEYEFQFQSPHPALVRIHDAVLIDNDFGHDAVETKTTRIRLAAGVHPFKLTLLAPSAAPQWRLSGYAQGDTATDIVAGNWWIPKSPK